MTKNNPKVSVIIPVYNGEEYLQECLDSIYSQTYDNFEIIAINDGSEDRSLEILQENANSRKNFKIIDQENSGQGYARNKAVRLAEGEYIQFVDADDKIDPLTLELTVERAEKDGSDIVHYDWKWSSLVPHRPAAFLYLNQEPFSHKSILKGDECDELMRLWHYFTVNNLYRKSFLVDKKVLYGEGRIYEDIIFIVLAANRANRISILHSPLYIIRRNMASTSRSGYHDNRHAVAYLKAVSSALAALEPRTEHSTYYLMKYLQTKFINYYSKRVPRSYRREFLEGFIDTVSDVKISIPDGGDPERIMKLCIEQEVYSRRRYRLFEAMIYYKTRTLPTKDKIKASLKKVKKYLRRDSMSKYHLALKKPLDRRSIVFIGFDFRYTGNSRYLFEDIIEDSRFSDRNIWFATEDDRVSSEYRITPMSDDFFEKLGRAEILVAESWLPNFIRKREDSIFIQLWHGTALKKMLFDSNESEVIRRNPRYKIDKHRNISKWDYLIADSKKGLNKFKSAFLLPEERIILSGYPRVKYLIDNKDNEDLKKTIRESIGLDEAMGGKKLVLYAPTWRDYNYRLPIEDQNHNYFLDVEKLADRLGEDYIVLYSDHHFMGAMPSVSSPRCINVSSYETQELLLVSDALVTDYSSVMFDAFAIQLPVSIYASDYDAYQRSRGVYDDVWTDLKPLVVDGIDDLVERLRNVKSYRLGEVSGIIKDYSYQTDSNLVDFIEALNSDTIERNW